MNISLNQDNELEKKSLISRIIGCDVLSLEGIKAGRNSKVELVRCKDSKRYIAKYYFAHELDKRDRMNVEFSSLQFLWRNGISNIPKPIAIEKEHFIAIYSYIDGSKIPSHEIGPMDIKYAVEFLKTLDKLKLCKDSYKFQSASEACFSVKEIVESIEKRYNRLVALPRDTAMDLHEFLENEFMPVFDMIANWCKSYLAREGIDYSSLIGKKDRTLSPSDFGFHNAIRQKNGKIIFLDFEYFGWDDPAKMISDFLLHPNMDIKTELKKLFVKIMLKHFSNDKSLKTRIRVAYPLFGLKWCLILLNEFLPEYFQRMRFAHNSGLVKKELESLQLLKARHILGQIKEVFKVFPYDT